jgi:hypothetical protein
MGGTIMTLRWFRLGWVKQAVASRRQVSRRPSIKAPQP